MTYTNSASEVNLLSTSGTTQTLTTAGKTIWKLRFTGVGGSWQLADNVTISGTGTFAWQCTQGTIDTNSKTITFTGNSPTFGGGGQTYADVMFTGGAGTVTITGANTITRILSSGGAKTFTLPGGVTTTLTGVDAFPSGTAGNVLTFVSSTGSATIALSNSVDVDYVNLTNIVASGTIPALAGPNSVDGGGNTNWEFDTPAGGSNTGNMLLLF